MIDRHPRRREFRRESLKSLRPRILTEQQPRPIGMGGIMVIASPHPTTLGIIRRADHGWWSGTTITGLREVEWVICSE